jgi:hypothetical protein
VKGLVFSRVNSVGMASLGEEGSSGIGRHNRMRARVNGRHPRDGADDGGKLGSGHESTNEASCASTTMGRVLGRRSIELAFHEADRSSSRCCLVNDVHDVVRFEADVSHDEIKIARDGLQKRAINSTK